MSRECTERQELNRIHIRNIFTPPGLYPILECLLKVQLCCKIRSKIFNFFILNWLKKKTYLIMPLLNYLEKLVSVF